MPRKGIALPPQNKMWRPLTKDEIKLLEVAAFRVSSEVGIYIANDDVLKIAEDAGGIVDHNTHIAKFPEHVVREHTAKAPKSFTLAARTPEDDCVIDGVPGRKAFFGFGAGQPKYAIRGKDSKEYMFKDAGPEDVARFNRWQDGLEHQDMVLGALLGIGWAKQGLPQHVHELATYELNNRKHNVMMLAAPMDDIEWDYYARIVGEVVGGVEELKKRPIISGTVASSPPLQLASAACHNLVGDVKYGTPLFLGSGNTPTTILNAAQLVLMWTSHQCLMTLFQAASPGLPVFPIPWHVPLNMTYGSVPFCSPESILVNVAGTQMLHELWGLPATQGNSCMSKIPDDMQTAFELALTYILPGLGTNDWTINYCGTPQTLYPEGMVMCNEYVDYFAQLMRRCDDLTPTPETMALDAIKEVGSRGDFFTHAVTIKNLNLQYNPKLADYKTEGAWMEDKTCMSDNVVAKMKELDQHMPPPLPSDVVQRINAICNEADSKLRRVG